MLLVVEQLLNGLQFGLLLFLLAAGLTLVFGIMDFVNLAHGSLYMMGAYFASTFAAWTGSFIAGGTERLDLSRKRTACAHCVRSRNLRLCVGNWARIHHHDAWEAVRRRRVPRRLDRTA